MPAEQLSYAHGILTGFQYLLTHYPKAFLIGQGLWSPWYVGSTMTDLDKQFGQQRVLDSPISEQSTTGMAIGAALSGYRPIVIHPRMDFMILAMDQIVNQAAKWSHMLGGQSAMPVTIRGIINRGGEQGAQHSQALHAWFAHVPGLRVVMPATPLDARDLLIAGVLCDDPVLYIDDRWLYEQEEPFTPIVERNLAAEKPAVLEQGDDITLVGCGYSTLLCRQAAARLSGSGISCEVMDLRILNPLHYDDIVASVTRTRRLCVVDGGWSTCGIAGEVIAGVVERIDTGVLLAPPRRITLPDAPAPTSKPLEAIYYPTSDTVVNTVTAIISG
jgi:pyruvate dehydrogenase E1 component beta subunit